MSLQSPFSQLLDAIQSRIKAVLPDVKWSDQDFGQLENYADGYRPSVNFPCILIDFVGWTWEDHSDGMQTGEGMVQMRIGHTPYTNSSSITPAPQKEKALQAYEIESKAYQAFHGWSAVGFSRLLRRTSDTEPREDDIRVRVLRFATGGTDITAKPEYQQVARPEPVVGRDLVRGKVHL